MASYAAVLKQVRDIVSALPDTREDEKWGKPYFVVKAKIFCEASEEADGAITIGFKMSKPDAAELVAQQGFWPSKYVGKHGWVTMDASGALDWKAVEGWLRDSFLLIAAKRTIAKLS